MSDDERFTMPTWEDLDFASDCSAWGNWFATFVMPNPWNAAEGIDGSFAMTLRLVYTAVSPDVYLTTMASNISGAELAGEVSAWWAYNMYDVYVEDEDGMLTVNTDSEFLKNVVADPSEKCPEAYCKALGFSGNNDITGIGVHTSYFMQAVLATLYLLAFTIASFTKSSNKNHRKHVRQHLLNEPNDDPPRMPDKPKLTLGQRTLDAFRGSLDAFLTTSMLMSVAMLCAAIYLAVEGGEKRRAPAWERALPYGESDVYNMVLSIIAASFSVFPVTVIYLLISRRDRGGQGMHEGLPLPRLLNRRGKRAGSSIGHRAWLRRVAMFVIWVLITVEVFLSPRGNVDYDLRHDDIQRDEYNPCNMRGGTRYWEAMKAAQWLVIGAPLLWMVITAFLATGFGISGVASCPLVRGVRSIWDIGIAWLNLLLAWALLAYFDILREKIMKTAGGVDSDDEWAFGQVLALATWMPVVLNFLYVFIWGLETRLESWALHDFQPTQGLPRQNPSRSGTWAALASKPSESDISPSRSETLVTYPYEGAGGVQPKSEWGEPVEMEPLQEGRGIGKTTARIDGGDTLQG